MKEPMKEIYFTPEKLSARASEFLHQLEGIHSRRLNRFDPDRSALLALDLQSYFLDPDSHAFIPSAEAILPGIDSLMQAYARRHLPIFLTRHINQPQDAGLMATWWRELISPTNPLSQITSRLDKSLGVEIQKCQYDAFYRTPLEEMLRRNAVTQVVVCGVMTHLCCETTARSAFMRGFEVFFTVDGTATYNEAFHRATLLNLAHGFATPALVGEILSAVERQDGG